MAVTALMTVETIAQSVFAMHLCHVALLALAGSPALLCRPCSKGFIECYTKGYVLKELKLSVVRRSVILNRSATKVGHLKMYPSRSSLVGLVKLQEESHPLLGVDFINFYASKKLLKFGIECKWVCTVQIVFMKLTLRHQLEQS